MKHCNDSILQGAQKPKNTSPPGQEAGNQELSNWDGRNFQISEPSLQLKPTAEPCPAPSEQLQKRRSLLWPCSSGLSPPEWHFSYLMGTHIQQFVFVASQSSAGHLPAQHLALCRVTYPWKPALTRNTNQQFLKSSFVRPVYNRSCCHQWNNALVLPQICM